MTILDRFRLDEKVAIITGASSGLGVAIAQCLAEAGADVVLAARRTERLKETASLVADVGRRAIVVPMDVVSPEDCQRVVEAAVSEFGRIDILVNNAGIARPGPATRETPEDFRSVIEVNLMGTFWMCQAFARVNTSGGSIVNMGSVMALTTTGMPQAGYASSKAAIFGLTRELAQQWTERKSIRVNALAPGFFLTEMTEPMGTDALDRLVDARIPMRRLGELEECAAAVVFLCSDAASYITGIVLPIDGGLLLT
jgi:NAD(P)-dependent dehydrogenase (short-subunit alcohol dehydrogenase family)